MKYNDSTICDYISHTINDLSLLSISDVGLQFDETFELGNLICESIPSYFGLVNFIARRISIQIGLKVCGIVGS